MFLKVILKMELRNGSHFYKNTYKVFVSKFFQNESVGVRNVFVVSQRVTESETTYSKGLRCSFPPPLDVAILPLIWVRSPIVGCEGTNVGQSYGHRRKLVRRFSNFS